MELRYYVEHIVLPTLVKDSAQQFVNAMAQNKEDFVAKVFASASQGLKVENTFTKEMFKVDLVKYQDKYFFQVIRMPKAEVPPYCDFIIIALDENQQNPRYFTLEKATGTHLICEWRNDKHFAYGKFDVEHDDPLKAILDIKNRQGNPEDAIKQSVVQKAMDEEREAKKAESAPEEAKPEETVPSEDVKPEENTEENE